MSAGGQTYALPLPFLVFATQNPIEQEGTYPLPEAQLDRFMFQIDVGYPTAEEEVRIVNQVTTPYRATVRKVLSPERIIVLPNAADRSASGSADAARAIRDGAGLDGHFVVGFCGSLKPWHGVVRLLDAAALAAPAAPSLRLLIVGDGPERAALERRAVDLGIRDRVCFTGAVPHHRVPDHLAACDVLAAPYESMDGFYFSPLKLAEYLQTGRPVLASAVGEIPQLVDGAAHVTLLPPGDPESIAREIVRHARGGPVAPRTGGKRPTWTWDDVVDRILEAGEGARRARWGWSEPTASGPAAAVPLATEAAEEVRA